MGFDDGMRNGIHQIWSCSALVAPFPSTLVSYGTVITYCTCDRDRLEYVQINHLEGHESS